MTDFQKFIALYKDFGIELSPQETDEGISVTLTEGDNPKFEGYMDFYTRVEFDKDGKFVRQIFAE